MKTQPLHRHQALVPYVAKIHMASSTIRINCIKREGVWGAILGKNLQRKVLTNRNDLSYAFTLQNLYHQVDSNVCMSTTDFSKWQRKVLTNRNDLSYVFTHQNLYHQVDSNV